ncbi:MAG: tRNA 5-methoxyuridine(34)/uridine 5-oxyacetic acid(34) synthase CmoB [Pseudomonadota bacterium]
MTGPLSVTLASALRSRGLAEWATALPAAAMKANRYRHGKLSEWQTAITSLPTSDERAAINEGAVALHSGVPAETIKAVATTLIPWRKGPFELGPVAIDTEWQCDQKWQRLASVLPTLDGQTVLDVGSGNGYFSLRLALAGAGAVVGIDPTPLYVAQYQLLEQIGHGLPATVLPLALEDLSDDPLQFDIVVSAGVLYHRRSPFDHLKQLRESLLPGGLLALETLTVPGDRNTAVVPDERYANMRNVWFLTSVDACCAWLERAGFRDVVAYDSVATTTDEQRATNWMPFQSLVDALDPADATQTVEGLPAPVRTWFTARR